MSRFKNYILNPETLLYEQESVPRKTRILRLSVCAVLYLGLAVLYFWIYISVLDLEPPKTALLKKQNAAWSSKVALLNRQLDKHEATLNALEMRNDNVYRSIFGMDRISGDLLHSGFADPDRYKFLDGISAGSDLKSAYIRLDKLTKETYVESVSFDEVALLSRRAGDMASCTPAIPPILPKKGLFRLSSSYGTRRDPFRGSWRFHSGNDFSAHKGTPVYSTADGTVASVKILFYGYGRFVVVDHGFGYKTMYAHLNEIMVTEGMKVKRGQQIGTVGSTGRSTGAHLHYEVEYRGKTVNPANYYDLEMPVEEYKQLVTDANPDQGNNLPSNKFSYKGR